MTQKIKLKIQKHTLNVKLKEAQSRGDLEKGEV